MRVHVPEPPCAARSLLPGWAGGLPGLGTASPGAAIPHHWKKTPNPSCSTNIPVCFRRWLGSSRARLPPTHAGGQGGPTALPCPKPPRVPSAPSPWSPVISSTVEGRAVLSSSRRRERLRSPHTTGERRWKAFPPGTRTAFMTRHSRAHSLLVEESAPLQQPQRRPTAPALPQHLITSSSNYCNSFQLAL